MAIRTLRRLVYRTALPLVAAWMAGGCASSRLVFENRPSVSVPDKVPRQYKVEEVELFCDDCGRRLADSDERCMHTLWDNKGFAQSFEEAVYERHPKLFARGRNAFPIRAVVHCRLKRDYTGLAVAEILTLTICAVVLPSWPAHDDYSVSLELQSADGQKLAKTSACHAKMATWVTIATPLGLIPVPGPSDVPKTSGTILSGTAVMERFSKAYVDVLTDVLAAKLLALDPADLARLRPLGGTVESTPASDGLQLPEF